MAFTATVASTATTPLMPCERGLATAITGKSSRKRLYLRLDFVIMSIEWSDPEAAE
jgi:hypothetical protein